MNFVAISDWDNMPVTLGLKETSMIFQTTEQTLGVWAREGSVKASKIGNKWVFQKDYVRNVVEGKISIPSSRP